MARKQKLELTWVGKDERPRLEPRILVEDPALNQYVPDFIVETANAKLIIEIKGDNELLDEEVTAKATAATAWCGYATQHTATYGGKPWRYALVSDGDVTATANLAGILARRGNREG